MPCYAVTGGAGFIGSHLVDDLLSAGHAVRVLDDLSTGRRAQLDPRAALLVGDVADPEAVARVLDGAAGVFHLAAVASVTRSVEDWVGTHRANQTGTVTVLDGARRAGRIPVVYASSAAIYGDQPGIAHEDLRPAPRSAYGADKLGSELHAAVAFGVHGVPTAGFRFFNVYGPRQDPASPYSGVISIFAGRIARGQDLTIHGDGGQTRDFVYVADVVRHLRAGMVHLQAAPKALVANVCTGRGTTILDLAHAIGRAGGMKVAFAFGPARDADIRCSLGDPARATSVLGVAAETLLADGLVATVGALTPTQVA